MFPDGIFVSLLTIIPNLNAISFGEGVVGKEAGFFFSILAFNSVMKIIICALSFSL